MIINSEIEMRWLVSIEHTGDHLCDVVDSWTQVTDQVTGGSDEGGGGGGGGGGGRRYSVSICVPICVPNCVPISVSVESVSISAAMA